MELTSEAISPPAISTPVSVVLPSSLASAPVLHLAPGLLPQGSVLHLPGRQLTLIDCPSSSSSEHTNSSSGEPYQRRFIPVLASPADFTCGPCATLGIWPSALSRKHSRTDCHAALLDHDPCPPIHGYHTLRYTGGTFSLLTAVFATINHGMDTVLTLWKQAELYLTQSWEALDCYLPEEVNIHNSHCLGGAGRRSLAVVPGLALPYTPSLLEIFQRLY